MRSMVEGAAPSGSLRLPTSPASGGGSPGHGSFSNPSLKPVRASGMPIPSSGVW